MSDLFTINLDLPSAEAQLKALGIEENGPAQRFLANKLMELSDSYVPMKSGVLKNTAQLSREGNSIVYIQPYSRYQWYGKLMIDPITGKGAFFKEGYGFWSRPKTKKKLTSIDLNYQEAPRRGPKWVERCWFNNKAELIKETENFIKER